MNGLLFESDRLEERIVVHGEPTQVLFVLVHGALAHIRPAAVGLRLIPSGVRFAPGG